MVEFLFADNRLTQGDVELARIVPAAATTGAEADLSVDGREYAVTRGGKRGWRYQVVEPANARCVCEFRPFRLRRGGHLISNDSSLSLNSRMLRSRTWRLQTEDGHTMTARVGPTRGVAEVRNDRSGEPRRVTVLRGGDPPIVTLDFENSISVIPNAAIILAFGSWLIVQYETLPGVPASGGG